MLQGFRSVAIAVCLLLSAAGAAHADEDDWQLAARAGISSVGADGRDPLGPRIAVDGQYGLTDAWALRELSICVRDIDTLPPYARQLVDHLRASA